MTKLTSGQRALLEATAAGCDGIVDGASVPRPIIWSLVKRGYLAPMEGSSALTITDAGRAAVMPSAPQAPAPTKRDEPAKASKRGGGKIAVLVGLLRQEDGATVEAMMAATGWQAHSVRGAISGSIKKTLGHTVTSAKAEGGRVYRIAQEA